VGGLWQIEQYVICQRRRTANGEIGGECEEDSMHHASCIPLHVREGARVRMSAEWLDHSAMKVARPKPRPGGGDAHMRGERGAWAPTRLKLCLDPIRWDAMALPSRFRTKRVEFANGVTDSQPTRPTAE
jgi:hypothetical protein